MTVLIAGGGISGLALALTCHQIGTPFKVFESVQTIKPLGVGINLQPTAVRELFDLGFENQLSHIGVKTQDYGMFSKMGLQVWLEPRGEWAGYNWPQYSVHRGALHMMLYQAVIDRAGIDAVQTGWSATGFENTNDGAILTLKNREGQIRHEEGSVIVGADGIHSTIRRQMNPNEGEPRWGGAVLWRGTTQAAPFKSGASMVMIGHDGLRFVSYPISAADPTTGKATINWIAMLNYHTNHAWNKEDWSREANLADFLPQFQKFNLNWIDIPGLIEKAGKVYEYPMVDRDPIDCWTYDQVTLMGDAAHAAYPVGSNGAGSGIIDARRIGAAFLAHGVTSTALQAYEATVRPAANKVVLMNRTEGPDSILDVVEDRCGGEFTDINDVIPTSELAAHAEKYKLAAGYGIKETNASAAIIAAGAKLV